jgi:hypothetical protein
LRVRGSIPNILNRPKKKKSYQSNGHIRFQVKKKLEWLKKTDFCHLLVLQTGTPKSGEGEVPLLAEERVGASVEEKMKGTGIDFVW